MITSIKSVQCWHTTRRLKSTLLIVTLIMQFLMISSSKSWLLCGRSNRSSLLQLWPRVGWTIVWIAQPTHPKLSHQLNNHRYHHHHHQANLPSSPCNLHHHHQPLMTLSSFHCCMTNCATATSCTIWSATIRSFLAFRTNTAISQHQNPITHTL